MTTRDPKELDDLLTQFAKDQADAAPGHAEDLVAVVEHLRILLPTPAPNLAEGRIKFQSEAARLAQPRSYPRRLRSLALAAAVIAISVGLLFFGVYTRAGLVSSPSLQGTLTPTQMPTLSGNVGGVLVRNDAKPPVSRGARLICSRV